MYNNMTDCHPKTVGHLVVTLIPTVSIALLVILGNLLVIVSIFTDRRLRCPQNFYLASLALVDFTVGVFILPLNILNQVQGCWTLGATMCKLYATADITLCNMSILHLCAIAVDRYRAISDGVQYIQARQLKTVAMTVVGIFILSLWISSPPLLGWGENWMEDVETTGICTLLDEPGFVFYSAFGSFFFPLGLMILLYVKIYYAIRDRIRAKAKLAVQSEPEPSGDELTDTSGNGHSGSEASSSTLRVKTRTVSRHNSLLGKHIKDFLAKKQKFSLTKERKAAKTLGIIIGAFVLCWLPFCLMYVLSPILHDFLNVPKPDPMVFEFLTWMGYLNSGLNPIIYTVYNQEFRKAFKRLLHLS